MGELRHSNAAFAGVDGCGFYKKEGTAKAAPAQFQFYQVKIVSVILPVLPGGE